MDEYLPKHIHFWMTSSSKHDCFFQVGPESGPKERIGAIKIFLVGHSDVMKKMLEESPLAETGDIPVPDSNPEVFKNFLICIYGGTYHVVSKLSFENCLNLLYLCEKYLTSNLKESISTCFILNRPYLPIDYVLMALLSPACLTSKTMVQAITKVIQHDTKDILDHTSFFHLDAKSVVLIAQQEKLSITEIELWKAVLNWAQNKVASGEWEDLRSCLIEVLPHIRFCTMESKQFCTLVVASNALTHEEVFEICKSIGTAKAPTLSGLCCEMSTRMVQYETGTPEHTDIDSWSPRVKFTVQLPYFDFIVTPLKECDMIRISVECIGEKPNSKWRCFVRLEFEVGRRGLKKSFLNEFSSESRFWKDDVVSVTDIIPNYNWSNKYNLHVSAKITIVSKST